MRITTIQAQITISRKEAEILFLLLSKLPLLNEHNEEVLRNFMSVIHTLTKPETTEEMEK